MILDRLKEIAAEELGIQTDEIQLDSRLKEDLKADSASIMMLVMDIENEFNITIDDDAVEKVKTVHDMVTYIEGKLG